MKATLNKLFAKEFLDKEEAKNILKNIAAGTYQPAQVASFMSVYLMRPISVEELEGFREAMLELSLSVDLGDEEIIDIVGTGGDGKDTFNISTLSCFVVAAAGYKVAKHGNYAVSSTSGSSNVLEAIGYKFSNDEEKLKRELNETGVCFLHAPLFHPAMKAVAPVRKEMGVRTFFNMLGPVVNPTRPKYQVLGTYDLEMARIYNYLLQGTDTEYCILHSLDGYDEISLTGDFKLIRRNGEKIFSPENLGSSRLVQQDLYGGATVEKAASLFMEVLQGKPEDGSRKAEVVAVNAAAAMSCMNEFSLMENFQKAKEILESGKAFEVYKKLMNK